MSEMDLLPPKLIDIHNHPGDPSKFSAAQAVEMMDQNNIERTVVMGIGALNPGNNAWVLDYIGKYPDRFVGGVCVDLRERNAMKEIRRCHDKGCRILKLFPNYGYYPDDERFLPIFEKVAEMGMGVLSHCGWLWPQAETVNTAAYYSAPGRFEKLLRRFPTMPIIFAHMGGMSTFWEAIMLASRAPNAYIDCSPGQGYDVLSNIGSFAHMIAPHKLIFGIDGWEGVWIQKYAEMLCRIGLAKNFDKIFYSNAKTVLQKIGAMPADEPAVKAQAGKPVEVVTAKKAPSRRSSSKRGGK